MANSGRKRKARRGADEERQAETELNAKNPLPTPVSGEVEVANKDDDGAPHYAPLKWDTPKLQVLQLVVDGRKTNVAIGKAVGVSRDTVERWRSHPDFKEKLFHQIRILQRELVSASIASKVHRIHAANDRWQKMHEVIDERGSAADMQAVPGGQSGLLVKQFKTVGTGPRETVVAEHIVDAALLREIREIEQQVAREMGHLTDKVALTTPDGTEEYSGGRNQHIVSDDDKRKILSAVLARLGILDPQQATNGHAQPPGHPVEGRNGHNEAGGNGAGPLAIPGPELTGPADPDQLFSPIR